MISYLQQMLPAESVVKLVATERQPIVILATTEAHCLGDLLIRHYSGELPAQIRAVVANHETLGSLVKPFGIPFHCVSHKDLDRAEHEKQVIEVIDSYAPEYIVLAKYMRILTPNFVARYRNRVINIHHSFLPAFIGAKPYHQAYERGVKIIGATAHIVTDDLDTGPIIAQNVIPVNHTHTAAAMVQAGRDVEKIVLAKSGQASARRAGILARQPDDRVRIACALATTTLGITPDIDKCFGHPINILHKLFHNIS